MDLDAKIKELEGQLAQATAQANFIAGQLALAREMLATGKFPAIVPAVNGNQAEE